MPLVSFPARVANDTCRSFSSLGNLLKMSRYVGGTKIGVLACLFFAVTATGCTSNLTRFDIVQRLRRPGDLQLLRAEVGTQGAGISASGSYLVERVTIGGSYLRRHDAVATGGSRVSAGLHANPRAIE